MTCIVGMVDKKNKCVWMGCDSQATLGSYIMVLPDNMTKVDKIGGYNNTLFGVCGTPRLIDLMKYDKSCLNGEDLLNGIDINRDNLATNFIPKLQENLYLERERNEKFYFDSLLIAVRDKLFMIDSSFSLIPRHEYCTIGSGFYVASGVLNSNFKNSRISYVDKIKKALITASQQDTDVCKPFYIMNTLNNEVIKID